MGLSIAHFTMPHYTTCPHSALKHLNSRGGRLTGAGPGRIHDGSERGVRPPPGAAITDAALSGTTRTRKTEPKSTRAARNASEDTRFSSRGPAKRGFWGYPNDGPTSFEDWASPKPYARECGRSGLADHSSQRRSKICRLARAKGHFELLLRIAPFRRRSVQAGFAGRGQAQAARTAVIAGAYRK